MVDTTAAAPALFLCADGGGSKMSVVIRTIDGIEARGTAGPSNVSSVGYHTAIQHLLLAIYRALEQLPTQYLSSTIVLPTLTHSNASDKLSPVKSSKASAAHVVLTPYPSPCPSRSASPTVSSGSTLPDIAEPIFRSAWLGLAGIQCAADSEAFLCLACKALNIKEQFCQVTNDVNLLSAPALISPEVQYVAAVVCGTGTVGRTIRVKADHGRGVSVEDVGVSRGWGYMLDDEGSAYHLGRASLRMLLSFFDRVASASLYTTESPSLLPIHHHLMSYFGVSCPGDISDVVSLVGPSSAGAGVPIGRTVAARNALVAGAARIVLRWAFPDVQPGTLCEPSQIEERPNEDRVKSRLEALALAEEGISPLVELAASLLGDGSIVRMDNTALALGGGLMMNDGYRELLLERLRSRGVEFAKILVVKDPAGKGVDALIYNEKRIQAVT